MPIVSSKLTKGKNVQMLALNEVFDFWQWKTIEWTCNWNGMEMIQISSVHSRQSYSRRLQVGKKILFDTNIIHYSLGIV